MTSKTVHVDVALCKQGRVVHAHLHERDMGAAGALFDSMLEQAEGGE